jgi:hypothetical protein
MKIYIDGQDYPTLEYDTKYSNSYIYTNDGIYSYKKELQKIETIEEIREKDYNNYHFFVETSKIQYTDIIYHIPYFHLFCQEEISKKNIGNGIFLVKVNYFDQVSYYFETDRTDESLYDAIITFLSSF